MTHRVAYRPEDTFLGKLLYIDLYTPVGCILDASYALYSTRGNTAAICGEKKPI